MLSIKYPFLLPHVQTFSYGLMPVFIKADGQFSLIIKATKEAILAARLNNEIKIYLIDDETGPATHIGFVTAFFDNHEEPLVIKSPQFSGDELLSDLTDIFCQEEFDIFFFDEHDRELMGVRASNLDAARFRTEIKRAIFPELGHPRYQAPVEFLEHRFGAREAADEDRAFTIKLSRRLYPDDFAIMDLTNIHDQFNRSIENAVITSLERENPGQCQERDIAVMLNRIFESESIYLNPFRIDTEKELTDILVVTDDVMIFIQAKDSPNTESAIRRTVNRKRSTIRSHVDKAAKQLRGALAYTLKNDIIIIRNLTERIEISVKKYHIFGMIVVREMFDDDYLVCSAPVLSVMRDLKLPIVLLDYSSLHVMSHNVRDPGRFFNVIYDMVKMAMDRDQFPKPIWSGQPSEKSD